MKLTTTKALASALNKEFENLDIHKEQITRNDFSCFWNNEKDYDFSTGKFNVIVVDYPAHYYAMPRLITTKDLERIYHSSNGTWKDFVKEFFEEVQI